MSGTWAQLAASAWLVHRIGGSSFALAMNGAASAVPIVVLGMFGGVAADRYSRRNIYLATQAFQCVCAASVAAAIQLGALSLPLLISNSFVIGVAAAYEAPVQMGILFELAPREQAHVVASTNLARLHLNRVAGPALAAVLMARLGDAAPFAYNALSFVPLILLLASMPAGSPRVTTGTTFSQIKDGILELNRLPIVAGLLALAGGLILCVMPAIAMLTPAFAKELLGEASIPTLTVLGALGASAGAMSTAWVAKGTRRTLLVLLVPAIAVSFLVFAANVTRITTFAAFSFAAAGSAMYLSVTQGFTQSMLTHEMRGRESAIAQMLFRALAPTGAFLYALVARGHNLRLSLVVGTLVFLALNLPLAIRVSRKIADADGSSGAH